MVKIEGGTFTMGNDNGEYDREKPAHDVKLDTFYMAEFQVTQELYEAVMKTNPSVFKGKRRPVEQITWYNTVEFCQKLNEILEFNDQPITGTDDNAVLDITKKGFRLPTEAEWEYAARGGHIVETRHALSLRKKYAAFNTLNPVGWYDANNKQETRPVGLKMPNELGLYDMSGNVYEWCWDWYDGKFYEKCKNSSDIKHFINNEKSKYRVLRGGSWRNDAVSSRIAFRSSGTPNYEWHNGGVRLVAFL